MKFTLSGFQWRKVIPLAFILIPWFFKDEVAATLDTQATVAQQVLTEQGVEEEQQDQLNDKRELLNRVRFIQAELDEAVKQSSASASDEEIEKDSQADYINMLESSAIESQKDLTRSAKKFSELVDKLDLTAEQQKKFAGVIDAANAAAAAIAPYDPKSDPEADEAKEKQFGEAQENLVAAYGDLADIAEAERVHSKGTADVSRGVAWVFTAIGALFMGGWKSMFGSLFGEGDSDADAS